MNMDLLVGKELLISFAFAVVVLPFPSTFLPKSIQRLSPIEFHGVCFQISRARIATFELV